MDVLLRSLAGVLLSLGAVAFLCQGPVATILIGLAWANWMRTRPDRPMMLTSLNSSDTSEESDEIPPDDESEAPSGGTYFLGLVLASIAILLDWICLLELFTNRGSADNELAENLSKAVPVVAGIAVVFTALGRARGKAVTIVTSCLIAIGSLGLIMLEGCQHMSW